MSVYLHEAPESRELTMTPPTAVHHWTCEGLFDDLAVANLVRNGTPTTVSHPLALLYRQDAQIREGGHGIYNITIPYGLENREIGTYRIECDTIGGTVHIKGGVQVAVYPTGGKAYDGLIGVRSTDDIEGTDIVIPAMRVIVHFSHPANYLTDSRIRTISRLVGSVDNQGILGWDPYETLFLGLQASQTTNVGTLNTEQREEASYHFAMSENLANFAIGSITGISKKGWDVAWVKWKDTVVNSKPSNVVEAVNVVRVYREKPLKTLLGFG